MQNNETKSNASNTIIAIESYLMSGMTGKFGDSAPVNDKG